MAFDLLVTIRDTEGDRSDRRSLNYQRRPYTYRLEYPALQIGTTQMDVDLGGITTIEFIYLEIASDSGTVYVRKNLSPEYWEVDKVWLVVDTDLTRLSLQASESLTIYLLLAGS